MNIIAKRFRRFAVVTILSHLVVLGYTQTEQTPSLATERVVGEPEVVALFTDNMPAGVSVEPLGRIFVTFPRWGDEVPFNVAEVREGEPVPYPSLEINTPDPARPSETLFTVQSVRADTRGRLWLLDTGTLEIGPVLPGAAKLVAVDLTNDEIVQTIVFPPEVALETSYFNDVRFDFSQGEEGIAYITDSSLTGPNAIVVVDLATGESWRKLNGHPSTLSDPTFVPVVEGDRLFVRPEDGTTTPYAVGADGIALSADGERLYYSALTSRQLYTVSTAALLDREMNDTDVAATVIHEGEKGASDGLEADAENRLYVTDYEHNAIRRRLTDGSYETLVHGPTLLWPDTLSLAPDGYLYFIVNQLHRQPTFHGGQDLRQPPYVLYRIAVEAQPQAQ